MTTPKRLRAYATELQDLSEVMSEVARLLDAVQAHGRRECAENQHPIAVATLLSVGSRCRLSSTSTSVCLDDIEHPQAPSAQCDPSPLGASRSLKANAGVIATL